MPKASPDTPRRPAGALPRSAPRVAVGALCILVASLFLYQQATKGFPADLSALYMAGYLVDIGRPDLLYDAPPGFFGSSPPLWKPHIDTLGMTGEFVTPYVYPPLWAALLAPLAGSMDPQAFFAGAALVLVPMLALSPLLAWRIAGGRGPDLGTWLALSGALLFSSEIAVFAAQLLQPQILVTFVTLLAFERYRSGQPALAGNLLGLAAMLKLAPAALALIFLLDRNWRSLAAFALTSAAIGLAGLLLVGVELHVAFLDKVREIESALFLSAANFGVGPVLAALASLADLAPAAGLPGRNVRLPEGATTAAVGLLCKLLLVALLAWTAWRSRARPPEERLALRLLAFSLLLNLFGPLGWVHYYLLPMFLLPALPGLVRPAAGYALLAFAGVLTSRWVFWSLYARGPGDLTVVAVETAALLLLAIAVIALPRPAPDP